MESELKLYLDQKLIDRKENPLEWWKEHSEVFPTLYPLAMKHLSVLATSLPSERLFSVAGEVMSERRNRISHENLEILCFLHSNM